MSLSKYRFDGSKKLDLSELPTDSKEDGVVREEIEAATKANLEEMRALQEKFYADGREGLIIVLQAMDAAGKDSTIKHVMTGVNPQGVNVHNFKTPQKDELAHDYLWRVNKCIPERGKIAIFNRSHYEDVLVVKVHHLDKTYHMSSRVIDDEEFFKKRYRQISNYEQYLYENSYRIIKIFLNVSQKEQKKRFLERIDDPSKNWKFSAGDLDERALWPAYMEAYEDAINGTAAPHAPWYVLPADQKWYTRYLVSEAILAAMKEVDPQYPAVSEEDLEVMRQCRAALTEGDETEEEKAARKAKKEAKKKKKAEKAAKAAAEAEKDADEAAEEKSGKAAEAETGKAAEIKEDKPKKKKTSRKKAAEEEPAEETGGKKRGAPKTVEETLARRAKKSK